jgi:hypothetical protein
MFFAACELKSLKHRRPYLPYLKLAYIFLYVLQADYPAPLLGVVGQVDQKTPAV